MSNPDWELIRNCPCPLWLGKADRALRRQGNVIAAIDPLHAHAKPAALDRLIVGQAMTAAGGQSKHVILCHAFNFPGLLAGAGTVEAYWIAPSEQELEAYKAMLAEQIEPLRSSHSIPAANVVIARADPVFQLPRLVKKHAAQLVVMGAVSRRGLRRVFIGHTAERVIDQLSCDVLIVKPTEFRTPGTPQGAYPTRLSCVAWLTSSAADHDPGRHRLVRIDP